MTARIDARELGQLLDEHASALALYASQWTNNSDDCVQEAMVELAALRSQPDNCVAWLFRVVKHRALNHSRSNRRRVAREQQAARSDVHRQDPASQMQAEDDRAELKRALDGLSDDLRELVVLRIWSGLGWSEIAELTGLSSSTAQRHYVVALKQLKERLETKCPTNPK